MRFIVLNRDEERIRDVETFETRRTDKVNALDKVEFSTLDDHLSKYDRLLYRDRRNRWREYIVQSVTIEHSAEGVLYRVFAENSLAELRGDFLEDYRNVNAPIQIALSKALSASRWLYQVDVNKTATTTFYRTSAWSALADILKAYQVEVETRITVIGAKVTERKLVLKEWIGEDRGKRFAWSKDMINVTRRVEEDEVVTALYGFGKGVETAAGGYGRRLDFAELNDGKMYVADEEARLKYGLVHGATKKHRFGIVNFSQETDPAALLQRTQERLAEIKEPRVTYEVSVVDLSSYGFDFEGVGVGDQVVLRDADLGLSLRGRILEFSEDLDNQEESTLVLGSFRRSITDASVSSQRELERLESKEGVYDRAGFLSEDGSNVTYVDQVIDALNNQFAGGTSNMRFDASRGIVLTDTQDEAQARWVMELGSHGFRIANSRNEDHTWRFRTFGTGDGFVADQLIAGTIRGGNSYWNLETGEQITGGWSIGPGYLKAGQGSNYVSLGTNESTGFILAGGESYDTAKFYVTPEGHMQAKQGLIGGWEIRPDRLINTSDSYCIVLSTNQNHYAIAAGPTWDDWNFTLDRTGRIMAKKGKIGGWDIWENSLFHEHGGNQILIDNSESSQGFIYCGGQTSNPKFAVWKNGNITAKGGTIAGWTITEDSLVNDKNGILLLTNNPNNASFIYAGTGWGKYNFTVSKSGHLTCSGATVAGKHIGEAALTSGSMSGSHYGYGSFGSGSFSGSGYFSSGMTIGGNAIYASGSGIQTGYGSFSSVWFGSSLSGKAGGSGSGVTAFIQQNGWTFQNSDIRLKQNIEELGHEFDQTILTMPLIKYTYKEDPKNCPQVGINANFVAKWAPEYFAQSFITQNEFTGLYGAKYELLVPYLIKTVQGLHDRITKLEVGI